MLKRLLTATCVALALSAVTANVAGAAPKEARSVLTARTRAGDHFKVNAAHANTTMAMTASAVTDGNIAYAFTYDVDGVAYKLEFTLPADAGRKAVTQTMKFTAPGFNCSTRLASGVGVTSIKGSGADLKRITVKFAEACDRRTMVIGTLSYVAPR